VSIIDGDQRTVVAIVAETTAAIAAAPDLDQGLRALIRGMHRLTNAESGGVRLLHHADRAEGGCRLLFWLGGDGYEWRDLPDKAGSNVEAVVASGVPTYTADLASLGAQGDSVAAAAHDHDGLSSSLIVPLRSRGRVIGTLHADSHRVDAFSPDLLLPLQVLADHAGGAVEQARLGLRRQEVAEQVIRTLSQVGAAGDTEAALEALLRGAMTLLGGVGGVARAFDSETRETTLLLAIRLDGTLDHNPQRQPILAGSVAQVMMDGGPAVVIDDYLALDPAVYPLYASMQRQGIRSSVNVPIQAHGQRLGSLHINHHRPGTFGQADLHIAEALAFQAGAAIERAVLVEAERVQMQARLAAEARFGVLKDEFVALVSHELRTPLTSIKGYADLLLAGEAGELSEEQQAFLAVITRNVDREVMLVNDLLDLSRLEANQVELTPIPLDLSMVLRDVITLLRPQLQAKRQCLTLALPARLPTVIGDLARLTQVFTNLVSNAHKYTKEHGEISVRAQMFQGCVCIEVCDNGIGLTAEEQARLFTKFFRAQQRIVQEAGGTGLGLAITRALVERHGGTISVASSPGKGSTFTVSLPSAPPE
jgi:signal transduction histidine kinase